MGGPGGAASGDPIRIGYINQDGGSIVVSSTHDDGVDFAVQFINEQAGGIGGRPIEIVQCFIANAEEEGQQCGQQFANDDSIVAVISGPTVTGTQSFYAALAESKPVVHGVSVNPVDTTQPNVAVLNGGAVYILAPFATFAKEVLGVESAALIYSEETQSDAAAGQASAFEALGIPIEVVPYSQNTPDFTVPLLAAGAQDADIVMPVIAAPECVKFAEAQRALGIPDEKVLASPVCLTPAVIEGLGDFPEWYYAITTSLGSDANDPAVVPYQAFLTEIGQEQYIPDPWVLVGLRPGDDARQVAQRDRPRRHQHRGDPRADGCLRGPADPRLAGGRLRQVPRGPRQCAATTRSSTGTAEGRSSRSATSCRRPRDGSRPSDVPSPSGPASSQRSAHGMAPDTNAPDGRVADEATPRSSCCSASGAGP